MFNRTVIVSLIFLLTGNIALAAQPQLKRVSPLMISELDSIYMGNLHYEEIGAKNITLPATVLWTHFFKNDEGEITTVLWDQYSHILFAYFLEEKDNSYHYTGFDTLIFIGSHYYNGMSKLDEPLVAPLNIKSRSEYADSFMCINTSLANLMKIRLDWDNKDISLDTTFTRHINFESGTPEHSFYTTGLEDGSGQGTFVYRRIADQYFYLRNDPRFKNQYYELSYKISDVVTLAEDNVTDLFLVIDKSGKFIYRNRLGIGKTLREHKLTKYPTTQKPYPVHLFTNGINEKLNPPLPIPWYDDMYRQPDYYHIEVDQKSQIWFNTLSSDKICFIENAFYINDYTKFTECDSCKILDLPKKLPSSAGGIKDIDCSLNGYITVTYINGIETYKILSD